MWYDLYLPLHIVKYLHNSYGGELESFGYSYLPEMESRVQAQKGSATVRSGRGRLAVAIIILEGVDMAKAITVSPAIFFTLAVAALLPIELAARLLGVAVVADGDAEGARLRHAAE